MKITMPNGEIKEFEAANLHPYEDMAKEYTIQMEANLPLNQLIDKLKSIYTNPIMIDFFIAKYYYALQDYESATKHIALAVNLYEAKGRDYWNMPAFCNRFKQNMYGLAGELFAQDENNYHYALKYYQSHQVYGSMVQSS